MRSAWSAIELPTGYGRLQRLPEEMEALSEMASEWEAAAAFWPLASLTEALSQSSTVHALYGIDASGRELRFSSLLVFQLVPDFADLLYLFVPEKLRQRGYGYAILGVWLKTLTEVNSCQRVLLEVRESNFAAQRLYERCAFYRQGVRKAYYANGEDAIIYRFDLSKGPL